MLDMMSTMRNGGYEAGKADRLKGFLLGSTHENDVDRQQIRRLRYRGWNAFRNNPQARKILRTLGAKIIGRGLLPQPQATTKDGEPFVEFRKLARTIFQEFSREADFKGKPGRGGHHFTQMSKSALKQVLLSGGVLYRFRHLSVKDQAKLGLMLPLQLQLLHVDRIDERQHGGKKFYGLELDNDGRVVIYHLLKGWNTSSTSSGLITSSPIQVGFDETPEPVPASKIGHLFMEEDLDQLVGSPWFGAALLTMDDRRNYEYSELIAAEVSSCIVAGYRQNPGQTGGLGLNSGTSDGKYNLTDADGNPVTHFQPGMVLNLGQSGEIQIVNPQRPNSNAEGFVNHLVRSEAVAVPGVKSSTHSGDYRNCSFSSERSADNDIWPEIEELQDRFSGGFNQPFYEEVIKTAVFMGLFAGVKGFSV